MKLTETTVKNLKPVTAHKLIADDAAKGLYLRQSPTGRITWLHRTRKGGSWRVETLGVHPRMTLTQARQMALKMGQDDRAEDKTFTQLLDEWFTRRIESRYRQTKNVEVYVSRGKEWLGDAKLHKLTTFDLVTKLQAYAGVAPVAANRCLANWKLALDYAVECGYIERNPLARTTARAVGGEEQSRDRHLTDDELRAVWNSGHKLLRLLLLTGLRISEGQSGYQDGDCFRMDRTKNGKAHWVHLPQLAVEQIEPFETSPTAVQAWLRRWCDREKVAPFTPHDLRRTFATRLAGMGVAPHVVEKMLNHQMQGVMATYNRHDYAEERIAGAELWAAEIQRLLD